MDLIWKNNSGKNKYISMALSDRRFEIQGQLYYKYIMLCDWKIFFVPKKKGGIHKLCSSFFQNFDPPPPQLVA